MLPRNDPEIAGAIAAEIEKQRDMLNLIASENYVSRDILEATGSVLTNKYAEGYPAERCYGGCRHVDTVEEIAIQRAMRLFSADHANVQPHAGSQANMAVYLAAIKPGDRVIAMGLRSGGHLTHGRPVNFSGMIYSVTHYNVNRDTEQLDYDEIEAIAQRERPRMIICGGSSYPRIIDFERFGRIARSVKAVLLADIAHLGGLIVGGVHPSPVPHSDFVSGTTHKTLRGPRGAFVLCRVDFAERLDSAVFPGLQGGPLLHAIAAKAICFREATTDTFAAYQRQTVANAKALAKALSGRGFRIVSGGTDNHMLLVDLRGRGITGLETNRLMERVGIIINHNAIPFDPLTPSVASGVRLGTPAVTTRGLREADMDRIAAWFDATLAARDDETALGGIAQDIRRFAHELPVFPEDAATRVG